MSKDEMDPTASTAKFQAFVDEDSGGTGSRRSAGTGRTKAVIAVVVAVLVVAALAWLLM